MKITKCIRNLLVVVLLLIVTAIGSGLIYEAVSESQDLKKYPAPGKMVTVNGHDMHIYSEGQGSETVVFASGWGIECPYVEYSPIYTKLTQYTRIAVYDRPGYGWSESSNTPRDIDTITNELHMLLELSGEKPPYILVGHSMASMELVRFAQLYPEEVKGIVTLDAGSPDYYASRETLQGELSGNKLKLILQKTGIMRLLFKNDKFINNVYASRNNFQLISPRMFDMDKALYLKNLINQNKSDEIKNFSANAKLIAKGHKLGNIPLRILIAEKSDIDSKVNEEWIKSQKEFLNWSQNSSIEIIKDGNHYFYQYNPDIVVNTILSLTK